MEENAILVVVSKFNLFTLSLCSAEAVVRTNEVKAGSRAPNCVKGAIYCVNEDPTKRPGTMKEVLDVVNGKVEAPTWV